MTGYFPLDIGSHGPQSGEGPRGNDHVCVAQRNDAKETTFGPDMNIHTGASRPCRGCEDEKFVKELQAREAGSVSSPELWKLKCHTPNREE